VANLIPIMWMFNKTEFSLHETERFWQAIHGDFYLHY